MNSFKRVCAFQIELEFGSVVFEERGKPEYPEKNLSEQGREPGPHWWEASALTTTPPLLPP